MKQSYILLGIFIIGLSILFIQDDFINLKVKNNGKIVDVKIIEKPKYCLGTKAKWYMKVEYGDKILTKQIPSIFCEEHTVGDIIQVKYLDGEDRILLPEEGFGLEFIGSGIFVLIGLYLIYMGMVNKKTRIKKS